MSKNVKKVTCHQGHSYKSKIGKKGPTKMCPQCTTEKKD